jgi:hypothetical protein
MNMWAGAGVGGLRTPARCLDSGRKYPSVGYLNLCIPAFCGQRLFFPATARCNWLLLMLERPSTRSRFAWL